MTQDTIGYDEKKAEEMTEAQTVPPLCLVHYFAERAGHPLAHEPHPPDRAARGRVVERRDNLIILEFAPPPTGRKWGGDRRRNTLARVFDVLLLLLLLASLLACVAAFRF